MPLILKNAPDVKFREIAHIFIASFERPSFAEEAEGTTDEIQTATGKTTGKTTGKGNKLLRYLSRKPEATIPEMATELGLTEDGINYHLKKLRQAGKLQRTGGRKKGYWKVLE